MRTVALFLFAAASAFSASAQETESKPRREPQPQVTYPLHEDAKPQDGVPKGRLEGPHLFRSEIIEDTTRKYWVYVPQQYDANDPANVLVFQDGARAINPEGVLRVPQVLDNLIAKKQIPVTIGIFITPGHRGEEFPDSIGTGNPDNRDREYDVLDDKYARFLIEEMLPEVGKKYNLSSDPADRAIGGSSSGAICAFTVAWHRPDQFRNVLSLIGSYTNIHGGHVYPELVREAEKKPIRIFIQDGINDLRNPADPKRDWFLQNQKMVAALRDKGYDMVHVFGKGGHSDDHGGSMLPLMLRWIWRDHPEVETKPVTDLVAEAAAIEPEPVELFPGFDAEAQADPTGTYRWENRYGNRSVSYTLRVERDGELLRGTLDITRGEGETQTVPIEAPVMVGNKLIFDVTTTFRGREISTSYHGVVTDEGLRGWQTAGFGGDSRDSRWRAERVQSLPE